MARRMSFLQMVQWLFCLFACLLVSKPCGYIGVSSELQKSNGQNADQRKFGCETSELRTFKNAQSNRFVK